MDASKFEKVAFARVARLNAIHRLVTDQAPPPSLQKALEKERVVVCLPNLQDSETNPLTRRSDPHE